MGFPVATGFLVVLPDLSDGVALYLAQLSCYYSLSIYLLVIASYSNPKFYPKPIYYCKFPINYFDFLKICVVHLLKSNIAIPVLIFPALYIFWIIEIPRLSEYCIAMLTISYVELIFLSFVLPFLIYFLERFTKTRIAELTLTYCLSLLYISQHTKSVWPILLNPLGNFLYLPIFIFDGANLLMICGIFGTLIFTIVVVYTMSRGIRRWEI